MKFKAEYLRDVFLVVAGAAGGLAFNEYVLEAPEMTQNMVDQAGVAMQKIADASYHISQGAFAVTGAALGYGLGQVHKISDGYHNSF